MVQASDGPLASTGMNGSVPQSNGGLPDDAMRGAIVPVGKAKSSLPGPNLSGVKQVVDTQTKAIGLIQPPPDIRAIVDKTAQFVAKNGELRWADLWTMLGQAGTILGSCRIMAVMTCQSASQHAVCTAVQVSILRPRSLPMRRTMSSSTSCDQRTRTTHTTATGYDEFCRTLPLPRVQTHLPWSGHMYDNAVCGKEAACLWTRMLVDL